MSFVRHYTMQAAPDRTAELRQALTALKAALVEVPGALGVDLLEDATSAGTFVFIEHWRSSDDHAEAGRQFPPQVMSALKDACVWPPAALSLTPV